MSLSSPTYAQRCAGSYRDSHAVSEDYYNAETQQQSRELPAELLPRLVIFLNTRSVLALESTCKWSSVAMGEDIWRECCKEEWREKMYVPAGIAAMAKGAMAKGAMAKGAMAKGAWPRVHGERCMAKGNCGKARRAFIEARKDAQRTAISMQELCDFQWDFHHTLAGAEQAGCAYQELSHAACFTPDGKMLIGWDQMHWQFSGLSIQVLGFPRYTVARHLKNWGFIMLSSWGCFTSFPMPSQSACRQLELSDAVLSDILEPWQEREAMVLVQAAEHQQGRSTA